MVSDNGASELLAAALFQPVAWLDQCTEDDLLPMDLFAHDLFPHVDTCLAFPPVTCLSFPPVMKLPVKKKKTTTKPIRVTKKPSTVRRPRQRLQDRKKSASTRRSSRSLSNIASSKPSSLLSRSKPPKTTSSGGSRPMKRSVPIEVLRQVFDYLHNGSSDPPSIKFQIVPGVYSSQLSPVPLHYEGEFDVI